jgi:hypothetical protein
MVTREPWLGQIARCLIGVGRRARRPALAVHELPWRLRALLRVPRGGPALVVVPVPRMQVRVGAAVGCRFEGLGFEVWNLGLGLRIKV